MTNNQWRSRFQQQIHSCHTLPLLSIVEITVSTLQWTATTYCQYFNNQVTLVHCRHKVNIQWHLMGELQHLVQWEENQAILLSSIHHKSPIIIIYVLLQAQSQCSTLCVFGHRRLHCISYKLVHFSFHYIAVFILLSTLLLWCNSCALELSVYSRQYSTNTNSSFWMRLVYFFQLILDEA